MKNLYLVFNKSDTDSRRVFELLKTSAEKRKVNVFPLEKEGFDFSAPPRLTDEDGLYKTSTDPSSNRIEAFLLNAQVNSFYSDYRFGVGKLDNTIECSLVHEKNHLPIIPTLFSLTHDKKQLKKYVAKIGGFPIIIKSAWKKHGEGVAKADSFEDLVSIINQLPEKGRFSILRKFIPHKRQGRLIVLGDKVIASHENIPTVDFRSNVGSNEARQRRLMSYDSKIQDIAIKAVNCLGYEFGGVDILFHEKTGEPYLAEVNLPCFFPTTQKMAGVDISGKMIDYLIQKSQTK